MNRKYRNIMIIIASVSSAIFGGQIVSKYGWIAGVFAAAFIGVVVGIVGRVIIKKFKAKYNFLQSQNKERGGGNIY